MDWFYHFHCVLADGSWGMLVIQVASDPKQPGLPLVEGFGRGSEAFTLQVQLLLWNNSQENHGVSSQPANIKQNMQRSTWNKM